MSRICIIFIAAYFFSCQVSTSDNHPAPINTSAAKPPAKKFFEYDSIDYYTSSFHDSALVTIDDNRSASPIDSLKRNVLVGDIPASIADSLFIGKLEQIGYQKRVLPTSKFAVIDSVFSETNAAPITETACARIYRDILLFRKAGRLTGIAKICFSCGDHQLTGTTANTDYFGSGGAYMKLENMLKNK